MLLTYLFTNFLEEEQFAEAVQTTRCALVSLTKSRVFPAASYVYSSAGRSVSFVADFEDHHTYRFHLRGHRAWHRDVAQLGLRTEQQARDYFFSRYFLAKDAFFNSAIGCELQAQASDVADQFDTTHEQATWEHFLDGVYGVCTTDGRPETIFLKQAGVMFIEKITLKGPSSLSPRQTDLLRRTVDFLDTVESKFAPHETRQISRQRCILNVRDIFFGQKIA
ncbi:MAG: DUF6058 family natural product biosynthesis protein [Sulfitobacter sp.]